MNFQKIPKLPSKGYRKNWERLALVSILSAFGINSTPLSTLAQTVAQTNLTSNQTLSETFPSLTSESVSTFATLEQFLEPSSKNQLLAQIPRVNQTDIPRTNPPEPQLPQTPQQPTTPPPIQTPPPSEIPQQLEETEAKRNEPICIIDTPKQQLPIKPTNNLPQNSNDGYITVKQFIVKGSTIFNCDELNKTLEGDGKSEGFFGRPLSFAELLQARSAITKMYTDRKYTTTGAYIPKQEIDNDNAAIVTIQVVEGKVEEIIVRGTQRLHPNYVRSRLSLGASTPLNEDKLLDAIKLLQVNPLIDSISAELRAGVRPGTNVLEVSVKEANTWNGQIFMNNGRSPSVGSLRRGVGITQANLLGLGDALSVSYNNTDGSNGYDLSYTLPLNAKNGTLNFSYGKTSANIIEKPFDEIDIDSNSQYYQLTFRQPIIQTSTQEFSLSLTASRNENQTFLEGKEFPIATGADREGRTRVSALRFAQELVLQGRRQVFAARSQFSWGLDALDATINNNGDPDSRFFTWRGQLYWVYLFGLNTGNLQTAPSISIRTDFQLADRPLLSAEQVGLGGFGSIRGYRQDALLTDNGILATAEFRLPIATIPKWQTSVLLVPFIDIGTGWNSGDVKQPDPSTLASVGLGLQLVTSKNFSARIDWGIPLVNLDSSKRTWQENGIYFSLEYNPF
jgi:hemolysin activation/secretion protein